MTCLELCIHFSNLTFGTDVAATGLPEAQEDHAERMLKFARAALLRVNALTRVMEAELGPGTSELSMRVGVHSGSVTAGVLRGQKARFQLFGDTMNMVRF